jgi:hypothetical protein
MATSVRVTIGCDIAMVGVNNFGYTVGNNITCVV